MFASLLLLLSVTTNRTLASCRSLTAGDEAVAAGHRLIDPWLDSESEEWEAAILGKECGCEVCCQIRGLMSGLMKLPTGHL